MALRPVHSNIVKVETAKRIRRSTQNTDSNHVFSITLERKLENITAGLRPFFLKALYNISNHNASTIADYILTMKTETNLSDNYRKETIIALCKLSEFANNKPFKTIKRDSIIALLNNFRKPESIDPLHKWIGTYNVFRTYLLRFFKWLYYPDIEPDKRPKPEIIQNIPQLRRKEKSIYKPTDLWTAEDDVLFLKFCPSKRMKCYHMMASDLSCRPHEILNLRIKDLQFRTSGNSQYAQVFVNGKTGTRPLPLIDSIPYVKDYLDHEHPQPTNPEAALIAGTKKSLTGKLQPTSIHKIYEDLKKAYFPKLLESANVSDEDKQKIKELLKEPWNPYIRRHSALTKMSRILKEADLRVYAGWANNSEMPRRYIHKFGNEACESILEARGLITKDQQMSNPLQSKQCPNCSEPNKPDSKFCGKCRMVLTYDSYAEEMEEKKHKDDALAVLSDQVMKLMAEVQELRDKK